MKQSDIRDARFPGRKRPVCRMESPLKEAGPAKPVPRAQGRSRSFPRDRPVVYGRRTQGAGFLIILSIPLNPEDAAFSYWPAVGGVVAGCAWNGSSTVVTHLLGFPDGPVRLAGSSALSWLDGSSLELLANMNQPIFCPAVTLVVVLLSAASSVCQGW